jgi:lysophospholipase L1-like esterase
MTQPDRPKPEYPLRNPNGPLVVLGASYAASWPLATVAGRHVINKGVAGQQSFEMLQRFEHDVARQAPRAVLLWGFINDVFRAPVPDVDGVLARTRQSYQEMIRLARAHGIEPIVATEVTVRPPASWTNTVASWIGWLRGKRAYQDQINDHVLATNRWLADLAAKEGLLLLDFQAVLAEDGGRRRAEFTREDGSHITPAGYDVLTAYARPVLEKRLAASPGTR